MFKDSKIPVKDFRSEEILLSYVCMRNVNRRAVPVIAKETESDSHGKDACDDVGSGFTAVTASEGFHALKFLSPTSSQLPSEISLTFAILTMAMKRVERMTLLDSTVSHRKARFQCISRARTTLDSSSIQYNTAQCLSHSNCRISGNSSCIVQY